MKELTNHTLERLKKPLPMHDSNNRKRKTMRGFETTLVSIAVLSISWFLTNNTAEAHGFLKTPRSRNYYAHVEGVTWGSTAGEIMKEYCPHCINLKTPEQTCGTGQNHNYDEWKDNAGNPVPWNSQETYIEGQEIIIESTLTTNHAGHVDLFICPNGEASTTECLRQNPLTFVEDLLHGGPADSHYPSRGYVAPVVDLKMKYRLPMGVYGPKVMIQWRYVTANSCFPPGYVSFVSF